MGLVIKRNKKGEYNLKSSISGEQLHDEKWISLNEAKKCLIERALWKFMEQCLEIGMTFPDQYHINNKFESLPDLKEEYFKLIMKIKTWDKISAQFNKISKKLGLEFEIKI